ncbi:BglG family transcription antiterminator [Niallia sp. NCCP-28]|uniref:BglG family transcription antiterminator n=1 Tax=Niallia sp. NCCP-28 TaxID=2934712 RepID=UPI00208A7B6D|nr:BglG family transcription antiterminator [Niallia sp. NCCP-28]GKU84703.1 transcriptional regulator MtlR [Niallia sp. NCCP-28]
MLVSARERLILQFLLENINIETTIKQLADIVNVSERTVHRDLKNIEDVLKTFHLKLQKKAGVGVKVNGTQSDIYQLRVTILKQDFTEYTPDERMMVALCALLDNKDPIKLFSLASDLGVTTATVSNDLDKLEPFLEEFGLKLIRKRGYGIELEGTEEGKRRAISSLISDRFDVPEFLKMVKENIQKKSSNKVDSISERLLGLVQKDKLILIESIIGDINEELPYPLADSSYVGLVVHLALAMERIQRGENIALQKEYLQELKSTKEFDFASKIAFRLEHTFEVDIPEEEIGYITMHLRGAKIRYDKDVGIRDENVEVAMTVQNLIKNVENLLHISLKDTSLFQGLLAHLQPTLYRLKQKMKISNPLLPKIKSDYAQLFEIVKEAAVLSIPNISIPEEEIGYLVLHFGSAINSKRSTKKLKVLIICSSGIGTSKMLAAKIYNQIAGLAPIKTASVFELKNIDLDDFDAVLSTIPLDNIGEEYLLVSPIVTEQDIDKIKGFLHQEGFLPLEEDVAETAGDKEFLSLPFVRFQHLAKQFQILSVLLAEMEHWKESSIQAFSLLLEKGLKILHDKKHIDNVDDVMQALLERSHMGGLAIPGTSMALYHTRNKNVTVPSFNLFDLPEEIELKAMNGEREKVKRILLLLAPLQIEDSAIELLSFISALIIQSETSIKLFEAGNKEELQHFISNQYLNNYIKTNQEATKCLF